MRKRQPVSRSGGIGRRAWFRSMYSQGCEGSSPFFGTKSMNRRAGCVKVRDLFSTTNKHVAVPDGASLQPRSRIANLRERDREHPPFPAKYASHLVIVLQAGRPGREGFAVANKLAVVTGASSGIGYNLAKVFAENGFDLVIDAEDARLSKAATDFKAPAAKRNPSRTMSPSRASRR